MASRHDIIHIDFQANAGKANVALQALQSEAQRAREKVEGLRNQLQNARSTNMPIAEIQKLEKELDEADKKAKQWQQALNNNMKGVRALDEAIKMFNSDLAGGKGKVDDMNAALAKQARNAAELQKRRSAEGSQTWKEMEALMVALDEQILKANTDLNGLVANIQKGGTASKATLTQARNDLQQMLTLEVRGSDEWNTYNNQLKVVDGELLKIAQAEQKVAKADKTAKMTAELKNLKSASSSALADMKRYWEQMVVGTEKGSAELAKYETNLKKVQAEEKRRSVAGAEQVLGNMSKFGIEQVRQAVQQMTQLRDTTQAGIPAWQHYNKLVKQGETYLQEYAEREKIARGEAMSLADALKLSANAGGLGFKGTATQLQQAEQALQKAAAAAKKGSPEWIQYREALAKVRVEMQNSSMTSERMQAIISKPASAKNLNELQAAVKRAKAELDLMAGTVGKSSKAYTQLAESTKKAEIQLKALQSQSHGTASAFDKAWSRLKTYIGLYMGAAVAMQKLVGTMGDIMDLSDKMGEVRKTTGFTADEVGKLSANLAKMDVRTPLVQLMEVSAAAGQLGLKTLDDVQGFTEAANKLMIALPEMGKEAATEMMRVAIATGEVEKIRKQMEEGLIEGSSATAVAMEKIASTIDRLRASSASTAPEITDFVKRVGAVGAQSGITIDQVAALGSTISSLGMRVEMSATALSRMIPAIKNNAFAVAKAIGVTPESLRNLFETGRAMEAILQVFQHIKDQNMDEDSIEKLLGMGGMQEVMKELNQMGARAGIVFSGLSQNVDELRRQLGVSAKAYKENIAIQQEFDKMNETTAAKWERLKNQLEEAFVSDGAQRFLGRVVDSLRAVVDALTGSDGMSVALKTVLFYLTALKVGLGEALIIKLPKAISALWALSTGFFTTAITGLKALTWQLGVHTMATGRARIAWRQLDATMKTNVIGAVAAALAYLIYKLYDLHKAAKDAAADVGRFNQKIAEEQKALNSLFDPLNKSNTAQEERLRLINEINSKYGRYLGYMLSETSSAIQLADAHALIAKRIKEEAFQRRLAEKERKIQEEHDEDLSAAYGGIESAVRSGAKGGADIQAMADMLKSFADKNLNNVEIKWSGGYRILQDFTKDLNGMLERMAADGKLRHDDIREVEKAVYNYASEAKKQHDDIMSQTGNLRSDLRGIQGAIKYDLANNLNTLISNVANSVSNAVSNISKSQPQSQQNVPLMLQGPQSGGTSLPSLFGGDNQQGGWQAPWQQGGNRQTTPQQQMAPTGWKPDINKKDITAVRQFVANQDALRGALEAGGQQIDEAQRKVAESWLLTDAELQEYRKILAKTERGGGGGGSNPWGSSQSPDSTNYKDMAADVLVNRRKQMKEFVNSIQTDTDVKAVLKEDAALKKAIENGMSSDMRTVIEWYNTERLKIQDELHARHLTNTGDWMDPKKQKGAHKQFQNEMQAYLDEIDAYYTERKAKIQEAQNDEQISEAEARNRTLANDAEWRQRRAELQQLYAEKSAKVTQAEQDAIYNIISERTGDSEAFVKAMVQKTIGFAKQIEASGEKGAAVVHKWRSKLDKDTEQDFLRQRNAIGQHMKDITAIVNKENPYAGITEELRKNLGTMDALLTDIKDKEERTVDKEIERTMFILEQSTKGYSLTWEELMGEMAKRGWKAWADAIEGDPQTQQRLMHQVYRVFEKVQDAIKKEASELKKQAEIMWSNILLPGGDGKTTIKDAFEQAIGALGIQEGRVSRANSLIGAGQASERVADKLAIQQMKVQLAMQRYQYDLVRKIGKEKIDMLRKEAEADEAHGKAEDARAKRMQAQNAEAALNLATKKEQTDELKLQEEIIARTEESQARLYKELREWGDLIASSLQSVMEASNAGNAEYYNELAKLNLTGKGGPGAGTYIVIENEGTEDAKAHYEYLDERQALERQHEIEQQNAQADAWKKVMDDINMKLSDTITDQLNAMLQSQSIDANTQAVIANTEAIYASMGQGASTGESYTRNAEGFAVDQLGQMISPIQPTAPTEQPEVETPAWKPFWQMTDEEMAKNQENMAEMFGIYRDLSVQTETEKAELLAEVPGYTPPAISMTDEQIESVGEKLETLNQKEIDASKKKTQAILADQQAIKQGELQADKTMTQSSKNMYAAMMSAANLYGIAYQAVTNDNLSAEQKFEMIALQAAGQSAMAMLQAKFIESEGGALVSLPELLAKCLNINPIAGAAIFAVLSALIGAGIGVAASQLSKSKSQIAQTTGASVGAGRLSTGMQTYAEGNVNEFTDPNSLTPGRSYNVDAADGKTYRAKYTGKNPRTHITNGPEFHLVGEAGREAIIDAHTTRNIQMNDPEIWHTIQTLYNGGSMSMIRSRRGRGVRTFAEGNLSDFAEMDNGELTMNNEGSGMAMEQMLAFQQSLDANTAVMQRLADEGIEAFVSPYGKRGIVNGYDTYKKAAERHGVKYQ